MGSRRAVLISLLLSGALSAGIVVGQEAEEKVARLRKHLGVPEDTMIRPSLQPSLPNSKPLRVALAFGFDVGVTQNFVGWVQEWNSKKDAKKHGAIELVHEIGNADIVLARYLERDKAMQEVSTHTSSAAVSSYSSGTASATGPDGSASASGSGWTVGSVPVTNVTTDTMVPAFAYIPKKTPSGLEVLGGYQGKTTTGETANSGRQLWETFKEMMKSRPKG